MVSAVFRAMRSAFFMLIGLMGAQLAPAQTTKPTIASTRSKDRQPHPATEPGEVLQLSLQELGDFDFDLDSKTAHIPDDVKALSGVTVKLHGFMIPVDQSEPVHMFALIPNWPDGRHDPAIQQTAFVTLPAGKSVDYCPSEIFVEGKLTVGIERDGAFIVSLFKVDNADVKTALK